MLTSLKLISFGKFSNNHFPLSSLSLFLGKNESGKSTIFDALLYAIAKPKGNHTEGKRLRERYGDTKSVEIEGDVPTKIDIDEFLNLHCLKSGEISIDFSKKSWVDRIRNQLFSGGIDPASIAKELERDSSSRSRNEKLKSLKDEIRGLETSIENLIETKKSLQSEEERIRDIELRKEKLYQEVKGLESQIQNLEQKKQLEEKVREKQKLQSLYEMLVRRQELKNRLSTLEIYSDHALEKLSQIEAERIALREKEKIVQQNRELHSKKIHTFQQSLLEKEELLQTEFDRENLARNLRDRLEENILNPFTKEILVRDNRLFVGGIVSSILGILFFIFSGLEKGLFMILGGFFFLGSFILLYLSSGKKTVLDEERNEETLRRYKREWIELGSNDDLSVYSNFQSLRDYFFQYITKRVRDKESIQESRRQLTDLEKEKLEMDREWEKVRSDIQSLEAREREILTSLQAENREVVNARSRERIEVREALRNLESQIQSKSTDTNWESLKVETERRLVEIGKDFPQNSSMQEADYLQLQKELQRLNEEWKKKSDELRKIEIQNVESKTSIEERFKPISRELFQKEILYLQKKEQYESEMKKLKAISKCKEIFESLSQESKDIFNHLSQEVEKSTEKFFTRKRKIQIQNLTGDIAVEDASGTLRPIDKLSLGTKDYFYIAAKLALCEKNNPSLKLFLMDEPFASLDEERTKLLIRMIRYYAEEKRWQLIVFSKDFRLKEWFQNGNSVTIYEL